MKRIIKRKIIFFCSLFIFSSKICGQSHTVVQKEKKFSQTELTIKVGDKIIFVNEDNTAHNVFSTTEGQNFNLGIQKQGASSEKEFTAPTENDKPIEVRCAIHPNMKLKIKVEAEKK